MQQTQPMICGVRALDKATMVDMYVMSGCFAQPPSEETGISPPQLDEKYPAAKWEEEKNHKRAAGSTVRGKWLC